MNRSGIAASRLLFLVIFAGCVAVATPRVHNFDRCGQKGAAACPAPKESEFGVGQDISRADACANAGYLCVEGGAIDLRPVARWRLSRGSLRIRVPLADYLPEDVARKYRSAAIEGIMGWQGHPFRFDIDSGGIPTRLWDIEVFWTPSLSAIGSAAGVAHLSYDMSDPELRVQAISVLASPDADMGSDDATAAVASTAAHEMGHALGMGHSNDIRDVMWPTATAAHVRVGDRDLLSVDALYRLPIGATMDR